MRAILWPLIVVPLYITSTLPSPPAYAQEQRRLANLTPADVPAGYIQTESITLTDAEYAARYHTVTAAQLKKEGRILTGEVEFAPVPPRGYATIVPHGIASIVMLYSSTSRATAAYRHGLAAIQRSGKATIGPLRPGSARGIRYVTAGSAGDVPVREEGALFYRGTYVVYILLITGLTTPFGNAVLPHLVQRLDARIQ